MQLLLAESQTLLAEQVMQLLLPKPANLFAAHAVQPVFQLPALAFARPAAHAAQLPPEVDDVPDRTLPAEQFWNAALH